MFKKSILLFLMITIVCMGFAQKHSNHKFYNSLVKGNLSAVPRAIDPDLLKKNRPHSKASGDTLFYEDFNGGLPSGWSIANNTPTNNFIWKWDTVYQNGAFSTPNNVITSTTAANGFMSLPSDFYNTPIPTTGAIPMNTYFESANIDLTNNGTNPNGVGSVLVSYQQTLRYCCSGANRLVLQVSTDSFATFQEYDATNGMPISAASGTVSNVINISSVASGASNIRVRFLSEGNSHFFWMIDDFAVVEGPDYDMALYDAFPEFNSTYTINPFYSQIPLDLFQPLTFSGVITNEGGLTATNARLQVSVTNDSSRIPWIPGSSVPGQGLQYFDNQFSTPPNLPSYSSDTLIVGNNIPFISPSAFGDYSIHFLAKSNNIDQQLFNERDSFLFVTTDTILAKDDGILGGVLAPSNFVNGAGIPGGTAVGDRLASLFIVETNPNASSQTPIPTSVSFLVSTDPNNIGVEILPKIWEFDENAATLNAAVGNEVSSAFIPYIIQAADIGTWITLGLDNGPGILGLATGQYMVGWETTSITGGTDFSVQEDQSSGSKQPFASTLLYFGHDTTLGWASISPTNPGIRLNFGQIFIVSVGEINKQRVAFSITPNPNNGEFRLNIRSNGNSNYNLFVRNTLGQLVHSELINVNQQLNAPINLKHLEKGIYFISLENDTEKLVQKIIIR